VLIGRLGERGPGLEIGPPIVNVAVVVAQVAHRLTKLGEVTQLVERITGVTGQRPNTSGRSIGVIIAPTRHTR
jgi:hypothetical protein